MVEEFGDIVGYTQEELEADFTGWIDVAAEKMNVTRETLLKRMKDYYDGFCFDGKTRLYNPFSILNFLADREFKNYWYHSGSPTFILSYLRGHGIDDPEVYRHKSVPADFADSQEIERAKPESFLYQSGYLTIESAEEQELTLDYPNREVLDSISRLYLDNVYRVEGFTALGSNLWRALKDGDIEGAVKLYNTALAGIPYQDFTQQNESLYRSLFLMLLRGAGVTAQGERFRRTVDGATSWSFSRAARWCWSSSWHGARARSQGFGTRGGSRSRRRARRDVRGHRRRCKKAHGARLLVVGADEQGKMPREVGSFRIRRLKNLLPLLCEWGERGLETDTLLDRCEYSSRRLLPLVGLQSQNLLSSNDTVRFQP